MDVATTTNPSPPQALKLTPSRQNLSLNPPYTQLIIHTGKFHSSVEWLPLHNVFNNKTNSIQELRKENNGPNSIYNNESTGFTSQIFYFWHFMFLSLGDGKNNRCWCITQKPKNYNGDKNYRRTIFYTDLYNCYKDADFIFQLFWGTIDLDSGGSPPLWHLESVQVGQTQEPPPLPPQFSRKATSPVALEPLESCLLCGASP